MSTQKNLTGLNDALFNQLNLLSDPGLSKKGLKFEVERTKALSTLAKDIVSCGRLALDAQISISEIPEKVAMPAMLDHDK